MKPLPTAAHPPRLTLTPIAPNSLELRLAGDWVAGGKIPAWSDAAATLGTQPGLSIVTFDCSALGQWDSLLLNFVLKIIQNCQASGIAVDQDALPTGVRGMLRLALAVPEREDLPRPLQSRGFLDSIGRSTLNGLRDFQQLADFIGGFCMALLRLMSGRVQFRAGDLWLLLQKCGPDALPIISLISLLVGMILAFVGAVQLKLFGAQIFIADLVGLGMAREMGAMMTAILMAGRTGAAFAAELGSMTVNDEIDALNTSGFSPMAFLVLPRIIALVLTTPLLCIYADIVGMFGGALVAAGLFDISFSEFLIQIQNRLRLIDFEVGIGKSIVFGLLVALAGCMRGLQCSRSATAVGVATTSAVVTGIVYIVVSDAVMTLLVTALNVFKR
jgi:phospholipid/cholesterol/gamma-HCH transport system permease protein